MTRDVGHCTQSSSEAVTQEPTGTVLARLGSDDVDRLRVHADYLGRIGRRTLADTLRTVLAHIDDVRRSHVDGLTYSQVSATNRSRSARWHPGFPDDGRWTGADWSNAMCGEAGEAANVVKKLRRYECGLAPGPGTPSPEALRAQLADEIADVVTYADLLATVYGIDLPAALIAKFNRVSERQGFPERLP